MLTKKHQNYHRTKLPDLGEIVRISDRLACYPGRRAIVEAFPLCDNILPWSVGIHTVYLRLLHNGARVQISGFWVYDNERN